MLENNMIITDKPHCSSKGLPETQATGKKDAADERPSHSKRLMEIAGRAILWHTPAGEAFATIENNGHHEHYEVAGRAFKDWLCREFFQQTRSAPSGQAMRDALGSIDGLARFEGDEHSVFLRAAYDNENRVYVDLGLPDWSAVEISAGGWQIVPNPPVRFRRASRMQALPIPESGDPRDSIYKLKGFLNLESDTNFQLIVGWILSCFLPKGGYPVLVLYGEQGTGKTTLVRVIRDVVDPNESPLRKAPKCTEDLMVSALRNHIVAFDNVSFVTDELSDDICRLATGSGLSKRTLYTNTEETVISTKRPCILNGIDQFVTRGDLADRSFSVSLPMIAEDKRSREETFWKDFALAKGKIFGALCSGIQAALAEKENFSMPARPRMADAFHWISAAEVAFGWPRFSTFKAFKMNQDEMAEAILAGSPIFNWIEKWARLGFTGTAQRLLDNFRDDCGQNDRALRCLPQTAAALGNRLRRLAPALRRLGIEIVFPPRTAKERTVILRKRPVETVTPVIAVTDLKPNDGCDTDDSLFRTIGVEQ